MELYNDDTLQFDSLYYPCPSKRTVIYSKKGMVNASQPLAAQAGLEILKKGGNAVDATIAVAACLTVVEPTSNGIGGDAFVIAWVGNKMYGLNSSGPSPKGISAEKLLNTGFKEMPRYGWIPVTVPGVPAAWAALSERLGRLPLKEVLEPAIGYAEQGYPVSPVISGLWKAAFNIYSKFSNEEFKYWFDTFAPSGRAPEPGEVWRSSGHANTLRLIGETKGEAFYRGEIAEKIDAFSKQCGGYLRKEDLENFNLEWVEPVSVNYRGYDVWELPPNGHGIVALMALNILKGFDFSERDNPETYHRQIEAMKLAFADGKMHITDPGKMKVRVEDLLSESYGEDRRKLIKDKAMLPIPGKLPSGGTVYLACADGEGNMVSYIQSNYMGFGSGLVVPGTGISLHNRGNSFSLDQSHINCLEPHKRPYHTIIPGFLTKGENAIGPFGVMGAYMQPQGHIQVIMNTIDFKLNPQSALDAPRWQWIEGNNVDVEHNFSDHIVMKLQRMGHDIKYSTNTASFGRGQIIWRNKDEVLCGGTEPRADGMIAAW